MPAETAGKKKFFDSYKDLGGGGEWMTGDDKLFLIENGIAFFITAVQYDPDNKFGPRWVAFCEVPNEDTGDVEDMKVGFPVNTNVQTRDDMLRAMSEYFEEEGSEPVLVKLIKPNRAILIVNASE